MEKALSFREWLLREDASQPSSKQTLYPMGYGGIGMYPPSDVITWGADAVTYMPERVRQLKFIWGKGMLSNPFEAGSLYSRIEGKKAKQVEFGEGGAKEIDVHTVQVGGLKTVGSGFEKQEYVQRSPRGGGAWDYKDIGERAVQLLLPKRGYNTK